MSLTASITSARMREEKTMNETTNLDAPSGVGVDAVVSLRITGDTELKSRAVMFGDGAKGYFTQQHEVFADGQATGVTMLVTGHVGQNDTKRTFSANGEDFDGVHDALRAAGHDVACAS